MEVHNVFTPGDYPEFTYVERREGEYEDNLKFSLRGNGTIVSLSGPSKSGKSMLLNNVVDQLGYELITVHGSNIDSVGSLWDEVLDELCQPSAREVSESSTEEVEKGGKGSIGVSETKLNLGKSKRGQESWSENAMHERRGLKQVVESVDLEEFVLYIDDAHYIDEEHHVSISETIKDAYERGMKICVAFIPYRSDDLTRANPDLSGRIESISQSYWDNDDLEKIGEKGFDKLNRHPSDHLLRNLAIESIGSPHLMQKLCLETCRELGVHEATDTMVPLGTDTSDIKSVLRKTGKDMDYSTVFEILCGDTTEGGNERNTHVFKPGRTKGDVYDCILRAIASNPPKLSLDQGEIVKRIGDVCMSDPPGTSSITQAISRVDTWVSNKIEEPHIFDWEEERRTLEIPDPYLIFYLRWSDALDFTPKLQR